MKQRRMSIKSEKREKEANAESVKATSQKSVVREFKLPDEEDKKSQEDDKESLMKEINLV